jgi:hypothetical protein
MPANAVRDAPVAYVDDQGFVDPTMAALAQKKKSPLESLKLKYANLIGEKVRTFYLLTHICVYVYIRAYLSRA